MNFKLSTFGIKSFLTAAFALSAGVAFVSASDWPDWRGPQQKGVSDETGLVSEWSPDGKNLIWRVDFVGRSTPVALNGRIYAAGRVGEGVDMQEQLACFDAATGKLIWEHRFNVFLTTIPFQRIAWASPVGDPETGNVYFHGAQGLLSAFDRDGKIVWQRSLTEEFGRYSGYGGRTPTPIVDGQLLILNIVTGGWGEQTAPRDRFFAFDKRTGDVVWISQPGGVPADLNTYSTPVAANIGGRRLIIGGVGDGAVYALEASTGEKVWQFHLSKRGLNASVAVEGNRVFASHSEENLDEASLGRVVAIDATGTGDVTKTHELWRLNGFTAGFASPAVHDGRLFVVDNSANLKVLDTASGQVLWEYSLGTVGKASPVVADGKLYVAELNGAFHIIDVGAEYKPLHTARLTTSDGRHAEIYGSPAVAYGRIYLATEEGLYCIGDPNRSAGSSSLSGGGNGRGESPAATLQVFPGELILRRGDQVQLKARVFDESGHFLRDVQPEWELTGAEAKVDSDGRLSLGAVKEALTGTVRGRVEGLEASIRFRAFPELPWVIDFESVELGKFPGHWIGAARKFAVKETEGGRVLEKATITRGIQRSYVYIGPPDMQGYNMQIDVKGQREKRRVPDMGLISHRYVVALEGNYQRLSVHSWAAEKPMYQYVDYRWDPDRWYTLKVQVDVEGGRGVIRAKAWPSDEEEPAQWTMEAVDPHPNLQGAPGIYGLSYADIHYDNLKITGQQQ